MPEVRKKSKEIDHYVKQHVGEALLQLRELSKPSNRSGVSRVYYTGNWVNDIYNNYTEKQAQKIFDNARQYSDKLDFFQKKLPETYEDYNEKTLQAYEYVARVK
jgi:hypothetical protein|tara:strand:- start:803 stop:1114 length:312 start_codon:yes stop_codon:yes gene_type:complete